MYGANRTGGILSMTDWSDVKLLKVFPPLPVPSRVEERSIYPEDSRSAVAGYLGRRWDEIEDEVINNSEDAFIYFTPEAYCYYLPALVSHFSKGKPFAEAIDPVFNSLLRSPDPAIWEDEFMDRWSRFSIEQLEMLGEFLLVLEDGYSNSLLTSRIPQAMSTLETLIILRMYEEE